MGSIQFDDEEEERQFFDACECSVSSAPYDDEFGLFSSTDNEVWTRTPESVQQRRKKFFNQMGFDSDGEIQGEDVDRIMKDSGALLRTPSRVHELSSSLSSGSCTDDLSISHEFDSDFMGTGNLSGGVNCGVNELGKETDGKRVEKKKISIKKKLLNRLSSITSVVRKKDLLKKLSPVHGAEIEKVKVRYCEKGVKELSALFTGQDIRAHEGSISSMKFSLDGRYLATGGEDGIVYIWQVIKDTRLSGINPSNFDPSCVYLRVNNHSQLVPLISEKEKLVKFRKRTTNSACVVLPPVVFRILEEPLHEFHGHNDEILDLSWSKDNYLLSASTDNTVRMWQVGCDHCLKLFRHNNYVTCVQFNPVDNNRFVSGSIDGKVRIWEISGCHVVGWAHLREIVTAVCYRPNGQGLVVGSMRGTCRFYSTADDFFQLEAQIGLHTKKKTQCKRITGVQFFPQDHDKLMVSSACSRVRILHGINVIGKFKGNWSSGNQVRASFTPDGKHIVSTSDDSNVYLWNCIDEFEHSQLRRKTMNSWERFSANASVAIPWFGFKTVSSDSSLISVQDDTSDNIVPLASPARFSLGQEFILESFTKGSTTWPEEKLVCPFVHKSDYKFLKTCQSKTGPHAWNMVIVAAGRDGRIRSFQNYGLPVAL